MQCRAAIRPSPHCPSCGRPAVLYRQDRARDPQGTGTCASSSPGSGPADSADPSLAAPFEARCTACARPWPFEVVPTLELQQRAPLDRRLAELATLGAVLRACTSHQQRVYLQLYLEEQVGSFESVADEIPRRWPRLLPPWSGNGPRPTRWASWTVRTVVIAGRQRILDQMHRRGLWRFS